MISAELYNRSSTQRKKRHDKSGFALVEVLIALSILSIILISVYSAVSASTAVLGGAGNRTRAMIIAKNKLNDFIVNGFAGPDIVMEKVEEYPNFYFSRTSEKYEHPFVGMMNARKYILTIHWNEGNSKRQYTITYINPMK